MSFHDFVPWIPVWIVAFKIGTLAGDELFRRTEKLRPPAIPHMYARRKVVWWCRHLLLKLAILLPEPFVLVFQKLDLMGFLHCPDGVFDYEAYQAHVRRYREAKYGVVFHA